MPTHTEHTLTAILPVADLDRSSRFYARLGMQVTSQHPGYWLLADARGAALHLREVAPGTLQPEENPCGLYLYADDVDALAAAFAGEVLDGVADRPWGMYEFAVSDPDGALVRVGRLSRP